MAKKTKLSGKALVEKMNSDIEKIMDAGFSVMEHENNSDHGFETHHLTIIGGVRRVEYYPSTGTVFANKVRGEFGKVARGQGVKDAIKIARDGRK